MKVQKQVQKKVQKTAQKKVPKREGLGPIILTLLIFLGVALTIRGWSLSLQTPSRTLSEMLDELLGATDYVASPLPLAMQGGDPYVRALMRTISAAESNTADPYRLLYGGKRVKDLSVHPDTCVPIVNGPNEGDCTTAAGRYQFLTPTWEDQAKAYHPDWPAWYELWSQPSFEPQYQDEVVYDWLMDADVWGLEIPVLLREGEINRVLEMLSGTWTSLGYGIEDNSMSMLLPQIYQEMLAEELAYVLDNESGEGQAD
ncbi:MAG: glycoside hydrolase family protein [Phormidesmis sp.]